MTTTTAWIQRCVDDKVMARVYLKSGKCLIGTIVQDFGDAFVLSGGQAGSETMVYKDMIATIVRTSSDPAVR